MNKRDKLLISVAVAVGCVLIAGLIIFGVSRTARAASLDIEEVTELRAARLDCYYKAAPDGDIIRDEPIGKGETIYMIDTEKDMLGVSYVRCNTENGIRYLLDGFTEYAEADTGTSTGDMTYYGEVTISAYYPDEGSGTTNHKGQSLYGLVGQIVACPSGSPLLGKRVYIEGLGVRRVWDTGCKGGRLDLLVSDVGAMDAWGLQSRDVWIVE